MWNMDKNFPARGFSTPPPSWKSRPSQSPRMPMSERKRLSPVSKGDLFHVIHKVPTGDSPYVKAKQVQLIDRDPSKAISMFWAAINAGDRVDSALKDMALVMKQLNRSDEAIEAIKSFRHICPSESQESLDNILVELYKRSGRIDEEIEMLHHKLKQVEEGTAFSGRKTKQARSQGKKIQITAEQEIARILGNLAWAYLQKNDYRTAEEHYRKALSLELDKNKQCNLAICLMQMNRITEAKFLLQAVRASSKDAKMDDPFLKSFERANQVLTDLESKSIPSQIQKEEKCKEIQRPVMSAIISKESNGTINESQQHDPGRGVSRCLVNGCNKEMVANRESSCGDYVGNNDNLSGIRSSSQYRPQVKSVGDWGKGSYNENSSGKCSGFGTSNKEKWSVTTGVEVKCAGPKVYTSSDPTRRNVNVPFTQPRRFPCGFRNGYQRKETWGGNHSQLIKNLLPCENSVNLGRRTWNNNAQVNDEDTSVMESNLRSTIEGDSDKMTPEDRKSASDGSWRSKLTSGSGARVFDWCKRI
ncbi:Protein SULFUR DEFICIENCY-INDUCED 1 [Quillaja saponaria]|uniref:Protein SULFUR DEFICIENCY-INDUCED 1 n=1 Tax=Quillaja saponaria TaxID=32244 RepID=A0AAD7PVT1_QUISA|nr:Protein SULFUR DEFICIENCY-INDUCED 1 [Quillaja saponaria]